MEALNDNMKRHSNGTGHLGSNQIMTRGLCLSELDTSLAHYHQHGLGGGHHGGYCERSIGVTAILCLSGLPSDLTASILAHGKQFGVHRNTFALYNNNSPTSFMMLKTHKQRQHMHG